MSRPVPAVFGSEFYPEMPTVAYQNGAWQPVRWQESATITLPAGAHGLHVERGAAADAELLLHDGGSGGELHIGRGRGHDNQINFGCIHPCGFQRVVRSGYGQVAAFFVVGGDMAGFDAGTGGNPLV